MTGSRSSRRSIDEGFDLTWDDITLGEELGAGSFGKAYAGTLKRDTKHAKKGTNIALKVLQAVDNEALGFFQAEVLILKELQERCGIHDHVLVLHGANLTREPYFLVTEFLDAGCLYDYIRACRKTGGIPIPRVVRWAMELAKGLHHLHMGGLVHRDLKSPNIMIVRGADHKLHLKLIDFGLAKTINSTDIHTVKVGSYRWMAPEVINASLEVRGAYDEKVDTYSYGMVLYELASGLLPFTKLTPMQVSMAVVKNFRPELPERCPPALELLIRRCWDTDPAERPSDSEVVADLEELLASREDGGVGHEDHASSHAEASGDTWKQPRAGMKRSIDLRPDTPTRNGVDHEEVKLDSPASRDAHGIYVVKRPMPVPLSPGLPGQSAPRQRVGEEGSESPGDSLGGLRGTKCSWEDKVSFKDDTKDSDKKRTSLDFYRMKQGPGRGESVSKDLNLLDTQWPEPPPPPPQPPQEAQPGAGGGGGAGSESPRGCGCQIM